MGLISGYQPRTRGCGHHCPPPLPRFAVSDTMPGLKNCYSLMLTWLVTACSGLSELVFLLTAHDLARAAGHNSTNSSLETLASIITNLKKQRDLANPAQSGFVSVDKGAALPTSDRGRPGSGANRAKAGVYGNRAIIDGQASILARLERIELRQVEQDQARSEEQAVSLIRPRSPLRQVCPPP